MKRRILSVLLLAALFIGGSPGVFAAYNPASIKIEYNDEDVSYKTLQLDIATTKSFRFEAVSSLGKENVTWKSSDKNIATVDDRGIVTIKADSAAEVNITCLASDGSGRSCSTKLSLVKKVHRISLEHYTGYTMRSESVVTLTPKFFASGGVEYVPTDPQLKWEIYSGNEFAYFSNPSSGTLCTNAVDKTEIVRIKVSSEDNPYASATMSVTVRPAVNKVSIVKDGVDITGKELSYSTSVPVKLIAKCSPDQLGDAIKWSSSLSSVGVVDGLVIASEPCRVIITASSIDGSGKSASVTINFT